MIRVGPIRRKSLLLWAVVVGSLALAIGPIVYLSFHSPNSTDRLPPPVRDGVQIGFPNASWDGGRSYWYNFTILLVHGNFSWNEITVVLLAGDYGATGPNSTLTLRGAQDSPYVTFARMGLNWSTYDRSPILVGQILSLAVDRSQAGGALTLAWSGPSQGSYGVTPL